MTLMTDKPQPTLDQKRANHAWDAVKAILAKFPHQTINGKRVPHELAKKYGRHAKKLPVRIMASGLGQALAFLKVKDYAPDLVDKLSEWIVTRISLKAGESRDLLERVIKGESDFLRRATDEVLAYLKWLNRFVEAEGLTEEAEGLTEGEE